MITRICLTCGKEFKTPNLFQTRCSEECKKEHKKELNRKYYAEKRRQEL